MTRVSPRLLAMVVALAVPGWGRSEPPAAGKDVAVLGEFIGSTPCGEPFGKLFGIPADATPPVSWALTLYQDAGSKAPTRYELRAEFDGAKAPAARKPVRKEKTGRW